MGGDETPEVEPDTESDPALSDPDDAPGEADWAAEGGALPEGPATDPDEG